MVLYHSEDQNIENRKELYTKEGKAYFSGKIYIPNDLETIELKKGDFYAHCQSNRKYTFFKNREGNC